MKTPETFELDCEYTDTFGGEANYCWIKRETLTLPKNISNTNEYRITINKLNKIKFF